MQVQQIQRVNFDQMFSDLQEIKSGLLAELKICNPKAYEDFLKEINLEKEDKI